MNNSELSSPEGRSLQLLIGQHANENRIFLRLAKIAGVIVRFNHVTRFIVNTNHSIV